MNAPMRFAKGAAAGLIATAPMTAVMLGWHRKLPWWQRDPLPPSKLTTRILRGLRTRPELRCVLPPPERRPSAD